MLIHSWIMQNESNKPMMIGFFEDEMTSNTTLLKCDLMVMSNTLVSCVIGPKEIFRTLMISIPINVIFFTKANLCCCINFLSIKHAYAL
jgi:hypothetical protein